MDRTWFDGGRWLAADQRLLMADRYYGGPIAAHAVAQFLANM